MFTDGTVEREMIKLFVAPSAVRQALYGNVMVKRELRKQSKLSINNSMYFPTLTYARGLWVVTKRS